MAKSCHILCASVGIVGGDQEWLQRITGGRTGHCCDFCHQGASATTWPCSVRSAPSSVISHWSFSAPNLNQNLNKILTLCVSYITDKRLHSVIAMMQRCGQMLLVTSWPFASEANTRNAGSVCDTNSSSGSYPKTRFHDNCRCRPMKSICRSSTRIVLVIGPIAVPHACRGFLVEGGRYQLYATLWITVSTDTHEARCLPPRNLAGLSAPALMPQQSSSTDIWSLWGSVKPLPKKTHHGALNFSTIAWIFSPSRLTSVRLIWCCSRTTAFARRRTTHWRGQQLIWWGRGGATHLL